MESGCIPAGRDSRTSNIKGSDMGEYNYHGGKIQLFEADHKRYFSHGYEDKITQYMEAHLKPGDTFLDVGANIGYHTLHAAKLVGETGQVFAIEPHPGNVCQLLDNVALNKYEWVRVYAGGLTNSYADVARLYEGKNNRHHSMFSSRTPPGCRSFMVMTCRGDKLFMQTRIHMAKIDTQGMELQVLGGLQACLIHNAGIHLIIEAHPPQTTHSQIVAELERFNHQAFYKGDALS